MKPFYKTFLLLFLNFSFLVSNSFSQQAPGIEWQKCLGGTQIDIAFSVQQTADAGYIIAGYSSSNNGNVTGNHGFNDCWIVKLDSISNIEWQKSLGGTYLDVAYSVRQTADAGYIVAGETQSNDGNVSGNHGISGLSSDCWIIKLNVSGNIVWQKCFGGTSSEMAYCIQQTFEGGYIFTGISASNDGDVSGNHGNSDYWIVKIDSTGNLQWQKSLGGTWLDYSFSILQTSDSGFIAAGYSGSVDGDVTGNHGSSDYWLTRLDKAGNLQWQKCFGGSTGDESRSIALTNDGGFVISGATCSNDSNVTGNHGSWDYWIVKLDSNANLQWEKCFGGTNEDEPYFSIKQTFDNGYIIAGRTFSNDGDVSNNHDTTGMQSDYWIIKIDSAGNLQWQKCLGGSISEEAYDVHQTSDSGYVISGMTISNDGDVTGYHGSGDFWIVKLFPDTITSISTLQPPISNFQIFPNPTTGTIHLTFNTKHNAPLVCEIINIMGQKVFSSDLRLPTSNLQTNLDVSFLAKGIYVLKINDGVAALSSKFVIE